MSFPVLAVDCAGPAALMLSLHPENGTFPWDDVSCGYWRIKEADPDASFMHACPAAVQLLYKTIWPEMLILRRQRCKARQKMEYESRQQQGLEGREGGGGKNASVLREHPLQKKKKKKKKAAVGQA